MADIQFSRNNINPQALRLNGSGAEMGAMYQQPSGFQPATMPPAQLPFDTPGQPALLTQGQPAIQPSALQFAHFPMPQSANQAENTDVFADGPSLLRGLVPCEQELPFVQRTTVIRVIGKYPCLE